MKNGGLLRLLLAILIQLAKDIQTRIVQGAGQRSVELEEVGEVPLEVPVKKIEDKQDCHQRKGKEGNQNDNRGIHNKRAPWNLSLFWGGEKGGRKPRPDAGRKGKVRNPPADGIRVGRWSRTRAHYASRLLLSPGKTPPRLASKSRK